ncbi:MAG: hypothetical protein AAF443_07055 [Chlamydiota bacterium]
MTVSPIADTSIYINIINDFIKTCNEDPEIKALNKEFADLGAVYYTKLKEKWTSCRKLTPLCINEFKASPNDPKAQQKAVKQVAQYIEIGQQVVNNGKKKGFVLNRMCDRIKSIKKTALNAFDQVKTTNTKLKKELKITLIRSAEQNLHEIEKIIADVTANINKNDAQIQYFQTWLSNSCPP